MTKSLERLRSFTTWNAGAELGFAGILLVIQCCFLFPFLRGYTTLAHDNLFWNFPVFHFVTENLLQGHLPLWNPFSHAGEPFYPILGQLRLLEPLGLVDILVGGLFTHDSVVLFNWDRFIQTQVMAVGVYFLFRPQARSTPVRLILMLVVSFSSIFLGSFHQDGILSQFMWIPYILILFRRIFLYSDWRWINFFCLAPLLGLKSQSYWFSGVWILVLFYFVGVVLSQRQALLSFFKSKSNALKILFVLAVNIAMMAPNIVVLKAKDDLVFPARMATPGFESLPPRGSPEPWEPTKATVKSVDGIQMPYSFIEYTGSFWNVWNIIQWIVPDANEYINAPFLTHAKWGEPSEAYVYFGMLGAALVLIGIFFGIDREKKIWSAVALGFLLLMLGPPMGFHKILYFVYPPLWFSRHTLAFVLFLEVAALYFLVLGLNAIEAAVEGSLKIKAPKSGPLWIGVGAFAISLLAFTLTKLKFPLTKYAYVWVLVCVAVFYLLKEKFTRPTLLISLWLGLLASAFYFHPEPYRYLLYNYWAWLMPALFVVIVVRGPGRGFQPELKKLTLFALLGITLSLDLFNAFGEAASLYRMLPRPDLLLKREIALERPSALPRRVVHDDYTQGIFPQGIRYLSVLYHQSSVFSPIPPEVSGAHLKFAEAMKAYRWVNFYTLKDFYELTHSEAPPEALSKLFAVDEPVVAWKSGAVEVAHDQIPNRLKEMGPQKAVEFLSHNIFLENESRMPASSGAKGEFGYSVLHYDYNEMELNASSSQEGFLYWADGYDRWWKAYRNGKEVPVLKANGNFKAVFLPAGESKVKFVYEPKPFLTSLYVFYSAFSICALLALGAGLREVVRRSSKRMGKKRSLSRVAS